MEYKKSENENTMVLDVLEASGRIVVTFTIGIKNVWSTASCVMEYDILQANLQEIEANYQAFLAEAKEKAAANGLIVF